MSSTQTATPELRQWILEQAQAGHSPDAVLQAMVQSGWDEEVALEALEQTLAGFLAERQSATASLPEAPISLAEAEYYCNWLIKGGYLRSSAGSRYCVVPAMRHGPRSPQIQRIRRLLDPNTGEIVFESHPVEEKAR